MQFEIEIWLSNGVYAICLYTMGWYENLGRYVYVNRGLISCFPGRVGIMPEITVMNQKREECGIIR
jgi:predicted MPP superfamily phosphohydrolase